MSGTQGPPLAGAAPGEKPTAAPKRKTFFDMAPLQLPTAICSDCGATMKFVPVRDNKNKIQSARFFCDICECGFEAQLIYFNGTNIKYEKPNERAGRA
jgi:hypothetical protein